MRTAAAPGASALRWWLGVPLGLSLALLLNRLWEHELRWFIVAVVAIGGIALSLIFIRRFSDLLLTLLIFAMPAAGFIKWFVPSGLEIDQIGVYAMSGPLAVGAWDFLLAGLYLNWFARIFVLRNIPFPTPRGVDWVVLMLVAAYGASIWGAPDIALGLFATGFLIKHVLLYFYVSRNLEYRHLSLVLLGLFFAVLVNTGLAIVQNRTGLLVGLAMDKGAGGEALALQYQVPGIEDYSRATGTTYDSHSLGLYFCMLLPFPLVLIYMRGLAWRFRALAVTVFVCGLLGLVLTFSRSAWISFAISITGAVLILLRWGERQVLPSLAALFGIVIFAAPWVINDILDRFASAPIEIMTTRFEQYRVAFDIWRNHPIFGFGVGNYSEALRAYNFGFALEQPVHNVLLWVAAEAGLFGVLSFFGMIVLVLCRLWRLMGQSSSAARRLALAAATALTAYLLDGLTDPLFRDPVVYMMFWFVIALGVALPRLAHDEQRMPAERVAASASRWGGVQPG
jgi:O-antigen ligase